MLEEGSGGGGREGKRLSGKRLSGNEIYCPVGTVKREQHTSRRIHLGRLFCAGC